MRNIKVVAQGTGIPVGTEFEFDESTGMYVNRHTNTEIGDGYEYTTSNRAVFSPGFIIENLGKYFEVVYEDKDSNENILKEVLALDDESKISLLEELAKKLFKDE